ncbi:MAG: sensor domain-containing diguanylate cyclase [Sterolibacterium sp.]
MSLSLHKSPATSLKPGLLPWRHCLALIAWALITAGALALAVISSLTAAEKSFAEYGERFHTQIRDKLRANEAVLYGFSSFLGAIDRNDRETASHFARSMLERYPHIYMLEIVRRVPQRELAMFTEQFRRKWQKDFQVKHFDYRGKRQWQPSPQKDNYYPIILAEPPLPQTQELIGLDIDSLDGLRTALVRSEKQGEPASSAPFRLVEGDTAYVIFRPVPTTQNRVQGRRNIADGTSYALMVVRARDLLPSSAEINPGIQHAGFLQADQETGLLFDIPPAQHQRIGESLFSPQRIERNIEGISQPLRLILERRPSLTDIAGGTLATVSLASVLSLALLLAYAGASHRRERSREAGLRAMEHMALHDTLTGLPNRFLMLGRLEQALTTAQRHGTQIAVLFLDLDGFKSINDRHGHHVGDILLREIGGRLRTCVRDCDTVSRHGGDEFIVTLTDIREAEDAAAVAEKVLQAVAMPARINELEVQVTTSVGIAIYPDSGSDAEALLRAADAAMYEAKAEGRRIFRFATRSVAAAAQPE